MTAPPTDDLQVVLDTLLSPPQLAEKLGVSERWIGQLVREHRVPFVRLGRTVRFRPSAIDAWLEAKQIAAVK